MTETFDKMLIFRVWFRYEDDEITPGWVVEKYDSLGEKLGEKIYDNITIRRPAVSIPNSAIGRLEVHATLATEINDGKELVLE